MSFFVSHTYGHNHFLVVCYHVSKQLHSLSMGKEMCVLELMLRADAQSELGFRHPFTPSFATVEWIDGQ